MSITFRNYNPKPPFTDDYIKIRNFLIRINSENLYTPNFLWGAWEWEVTHSGLDRNNLDKFGIWEDKDEIVAIAIYEMPLGDGLLIVDEAYRHLIPDMITYAKNSLHDNGKLRILIDSRDCEFARVAMQHGFRPTQSRWNSAVLDIDKLKSFSLPEGFSFVSMADGWNWQQYNRVMWRGFDHQGKVNHDDATIAERKEMLSSKMINKELVVAVVAPDGNYVSHCGMWYNPRDFYCYVEPVVTDPEYRKMGLGKAAVLEAILRCSKLGAKQALVSSSQQFYYNIGFYPIQTSTWWELKVRGDECCTAV